MQLNHLYLICDHPVEYAPQCLMIRGAYNLLGYIAYDSLLVASGPPVIRSVLVRVPGSVPNQGTTRKAEVVIPPPKFQISHHRLPALKQ